MLYPVELVVEKRPLVAGALLQRAVSARVVVVEVLAVVLAEIRSQLAVEVGESGLQATANLRLQLCACSFPMKKGDHNKVPQYM